MSNPTPNAPWRCARCNTRNLASANVCARCGALLYRNKPACIAHTIAFFAAAAILFVVANLHPVLSLDAQGIETETTLLGAARAE